MVILDKTSLEPLSASGYYRLYENDEATLSAYLEGYGDGFKFGVLGHPAHLIAPTRETSIAAAKTNGYTLGYKRGLSVFREMSGKTDGYRKSH